MGSQFSQNQLLNEDQCKKLAGDRFSSSLFVKYANSDRKILISKLEELRDRPEVLLVYSDDDPGGKVLLNHIFAALLKAGILAKIILGIS